MLVDGSGLDIPAERDDPPTGPAPLSIGCAPLVVVIGTPPIMVLVVRLVGDAVLELVVIGALL